MEKVVRWERYLPRRVVRVLVVEPDESTRNVISALLRNCNYKVKSVADGLEAWEALKEKPESIDLVLTEVDLPSISGFTLLTLLTDHPHHPCARIPVIMMSSKDSISTVVKCMMKGAADFLIKPLRKNELKNIWQHLWRRHLSISENKHPATGEECLKLAARSSLNALISSEQEEVESKDLKIISKIEREDSLDKLKARNGFDGERVEIDEDSGQHRVIGDFGPETLCAESKNLDAVTVIEDGAIVKRAKLHDLAVERFGDFELPGRNVLFQESVSPAANPDCDLKLELSLQGSVPSDPTSKEANGRSLLYHSSASAFSRYSSRIRNGCSLPSYSATMNESKEARHSVKTVNNCATLKVENTSASALELFLPRDRSETSNVTSDRPDHTLRAHSSHNNVPWIFPITDKTDKSAIQLSYSRSAEPISGGPNGVESFRISAREAALIKFRHKRKERCFEKKVRYHSRKQLAEQRPRVKGQFVRQMQMQMDSAS